jgi:hypothetical protein
MFREKNEWHAAAKPKVFVMNMMKLGAPNWEVGDTQWRSWLRHCATNRKVVGSIPGGFIGICN